MFIIRCLCILFAAIWSLTAVSAYPASKVDTEEVTAADVEMLQAKLKQNPENPVLLQGLGRYFYRTEDMEKAKGYAERLLKYAEKSGDRDFSEMWGRYLMGSVLISSGETIEALSNLETARSIAETNKDQDALSLIYNTLGLLYMFHNNDPFTATNFYYQALESARNEKNFKREAPILANLAAAFLTMEDPSGLIIAQQAVELSEKYDKEYTIKPRIILTEMYLLADSTSMARSTLNTILQKESDSVKQSFSSILKFLEALITEKEGNTDDAIRGLKELLTEEDDDASWISSISIALAESLEKKGKYVEGSEILEKALANSRSSQVHIHSSKLMRTLVRLYLKAGMKDNAITVGQEYISYRDSIYTIGHQKSLQESRIRHEVFTKQRQIDEQKLQIASKNSKILLLCIGLGLVSVLLAVIFAAYRKREQLYKTIVARNTEFLRHDRLQNEEIETLRRKLSSFSAVQKVVSDEETQKQLKTEDTMYHDLMERFTSYMENDKGYTDPQLTIAGVAKALGSNRTYLSKAINVSTGKTFLQVINEYRMRRAVELISDTESDIPLKQIAADLGYNSITTFYSCFNSYTGMTPAKYRDHLRRIHPVIRTGNEES